MSTRVAVIGCGVFGALSALRLAEAGANVTVFERSSAPLMGASYNNHNRLHLGFHYPRDERTVRQCLEGFQRFKDEFSECVLEGFDNAYFIASGGSLTSAKDYLSFFQRLGVECEMINAGSFARVENVDIGVLTKEAVYDCRILRRIISERLLSKGIFTRFGQEVQHIAKRSGKFVLSSPGGFDEFDGVVNCSYAEINRLGRMLGHECPEFQYEYTAIPVLNWNRPPVGIAIMDGPFMAVLPFGKRPGKFLLYHVARSVVERQNGTQLPLSWKDASTAPKIPPSFANDMIESCCEFVPDLKEARWSGELLESPRMVLAHHEKSDARPSLVRQIEPGYVRVFSGKIDHCIWAAEEVTATLMRKP